MDDPLVWSTGRGTDVWEMFVACRDGNPAAVEALLEKDPSLVRSSYDRGTPLYFAVRENRIEVARLLLERGAAPLSGELREIARDRGYAAMSQLLEEIVSRAYGVSAAGESLAAAIRVHDLKLVGEWLDRSPGDISAADARGNQPIHWASMTRQPAVIDELLRRGADINARRPDGARAIQLAAGDYYFRGRLEVSKEWPVTPRATIDHLRACRAEVDLCTACHIGDEALVRELLARYAGLANRVDPYVTYYPCSGTPLRNAAEAGHIAIVKLLLQAGADPNLPEPGIAPQGHALYAAAAAGYHEIAALLLENGANANAAVESSADALSRAIDNKDQKMVDLLCSYGASRGMHLLAYYGDVRTAAAVFAANPKLAEDPDALMNAAGEAQIGFVRLMLRYCPELPKRLTFPGWSVGGKTRELNELLFRHGMNASAPDWLGITPLHHFARTDDCGQAEMFLAHGADVEAQDDHMGSTPLGWTARFGKIKMAELLLRHGAKVNSGESEWAAPLAWARRYGHDEVAALLRRNGAS